jgi:hypothetical protein
LNVSDLCPLSNTNLVLTRVAVPAVFTIGPLDAVAALEKYAVLLSGDSHGQTPNSKVLGTGRDHVQGIVRGIIEGETRYGLSRDCGRLRSTADV